MPGCTAFGAATPRPAASSLVGPLVGRPDEAGSLVAGSLLADALTSARVPDRGYAITRQQCLPRESSHIQSPWRRSITCASVALVLKRLMLVTRSYIDLLRVASAACPAG
ncbi:hypothetical protein FAIPA1_10596 [Frankia sp. AiPs1]